MKIGGRKGENESDESMRNDRKWKWRATWGADEREQDEK